MTKFQEITIFVASILVYAMACVAHSEAAAPSWFIQTPNDDDYYYGVGHSKESLEAAEAKSRETLIMGIVVTIHAKVEQHSQSVADGNSEKIEAEFRTQSRSYAKQELLPGIEIGKRSHGPSDYYALARLSRETYRQHMDQKHTEVGKVAASGDKSLADGHVIAALKAYSAALTTAKTLTFLDGEASDAVSVVDIRQKIAAVQNDIHIISISGNEQTVNYGEPLPQPLVVEVHYQSKPLGECPLQATYIHGTGQLRNSCGEAGTSVSIYADAEGKRVCWVVAAKSISRKNRIQVTVDVESIQLPASQTAIFRYKSVFPRQRKTDALTINGSVDEATLTFAEGSEVDLEIRVPNKCHIHLFQIVANGDLVYKQSVPSTQAYVENGWRVISTDPGWSLQMDRVPLRADYGHGVETLLVIITAKAWQPNGEQVMRYSLIRQLDESVGADGWRVDWVSYYIEPKKEAIK